MHPNFPAYHREAELVALRYMKPHWENPTRLIIPYKTEVYRSFLDELKPIWCKHFGADSWPKIWVGGQV